MRPGDGRRTSVGRTKALLVFGSAAAARGVVTTIAARVVSPDEASPERLLFQGPVSVDGRAKEHLQTMVLSVVDRLTGRLGLPPLHFLLSFANLGAASATDLGADISGFSADVPIVVALLSAALQIPIEQGLASTGHLASPEGDITLVRGLAAKIEAALQAGNISRLIIPNLEGDASLRSLAPQEYERLKASIKSVASRIEVHQVEDVAGLVTAAFSEEAMVVGSLTSGYFSIEDDTPQDDGGPIGRAALNLTSDNHARFWRALQVHLLAGDYAAGKALLGVFVDHHLSREEYPRGLGSRLRLLVLSIPPSRWRASGFFPLLPMPTCIALSNLAGEAEYPDVLLLYQASFGEDLAIARRTAPTKEDTGDTLDHPASPVLEMLLARITPAAIAEQVALPLDEARARYQMDTVVVEDADQFNRALLSFYAHLLRHTHEAVGRLNEDALLGEALDILERAFSREGGYRGALAEALDGTRGGLRFIFDLLTEQLKRDQTERYLQLVFTEAVDPLDWDGKVELMRELLERIGPDLPPEVREQPPQRYAADSELVIRFYVESLEKLTNLLKSL